MNNVFDQMLSKYHIITEDDRRNAIYEVMQQIALAGLYRGGFFEKAAFYGGTCLRIFHKLERFSEDMDFSLLQPNSEFALEQYFPAIIEEFKTVGREISINKKNKSNFGKIESAFLKDDTEVYNLTFKTEKTIKNKSEVYTDPPLRYKTEQKRLIQPSTFMSNCFTLPDLYAGKMHAVVIINGKNHVNG